MSWFDAILTVFKYGAYIVGFVVALFTFVVTIYAIGEGINKVLGFDDSSVFGQFAFVFGAIFCGIVYAVHEEDKYEQVCVTKTVVELGGCTEYKGARNCTVRFEDGTRGAYTNPLLGDKYPVCHREKKDKS